MTARLAASTRSSGRLSPVLELPHRTPSAATARAGIPATTSPAPTSRVTTAPAPTSAPAPMRTPQRPVVSRLQIAAAGRRARPLVVDEEDAVPDEDLVRKRHARADERVALDLAARADLDPALDLDERTDSALVADPAAVEVRERVHHDARAELHVVKESVRRLVFRPVRHGHEPEKNVFTACTTASSCASVMPGKSGRESASRESASATGNAPGW